MHVVEPASKEVRGDVRTTAQSTWRFNVFCPRFLQWSRLEFLR
jgi:hypothetical protein